MEHRLIRAMTKDGATNVDALCLTNLAVHAALDQKGGYRVTHIATGMCLSRTSIPMPDAMMIAYLLDDLMSFDVAPADPVRRKEFNAAWVNATRHTEATMAMVKRGE